MMLVILEHGRISSDSIELNDSQVRFDSLSVNLILGELHFT